MMMVIIIIIIIYYYLSFFYFLTLGRSSRGREKLLENTKTLKVIIRAVLLSKALVQQDGIVTLY